jgi:hypothetical protein
MVSNDPSDPSKSRAAQDVEAPAHHNKQPQGTFHWGRGGEGNMMTVGGGDQRPSSKERKTSGENQRRGSVQGILEKGKELLGLKKKKSGEAQAVEKNKTGPESEGRNSSVAVSSSDE